MTERVLEPQRFLLWRESDVSGVSGTGLVAWGVEFPDGNVVTRWNAEIAQTCVWASIEEVQKVHGHGGATRVVYIDQKFDNTHQLQQFLMLLDDMDRCEHGRHETDFCNMCEGMSKGNPYMDEHRTIGHTLDGLAITLPDRRVLRRRGNPSEWNARLTDHPAYPSWQTTDIPDDEVAQDQVDWRAMALRVKHEGLVRVRPEENSDD